MNIKREDFKNHPIEVIGGYQLERIARIKMSKKFWEVYSELMKLSYQCGWDDHKKRVNYDMLNDPDHDWPNKLKEIWNRIEEKQT